MRFAVDRLDHLVINCRDLEVMASWYQRVLGMEAVWRIEVEDFPAFIVVDDKGNDFYEGLE